MTVIIFMQSVCKLIFPDIVIKTIVFCNFVYCNIILMWKGATLLVIQYLKFSYVLCDGTYECGDHGRFEYCIDEIPGCIVGCHCHPGYYFDTDTKICEPNAKLIEHNRRRYVAESMQVQNNLMTPNSISVTDPVAADKIDGAVDEISKDAEDLGDWLYSQFFKAIENQVINNTSDKSIFTRRSGSVQSIKKSKGRKRFKKRKNGKNKKKGKKDNLRKKLLQITENDSVFDLSSSSKSDSSDSTSSSSDSSGEYNSHDNEDGHGHKKIVMIKKKPKQLPNFIFLPNLETPFYPPLGLPPPPIPIPMYPMVPVPPMICNTEDLDDSGNETTAAPTETTTISISANTPFTTTLISVETTTSAKKPNDNKTGTLRHSSKKRKPLIRPQMTNGESANDLRYSKLRSPIRQQILQHLKQKMQNHSKKLSLMASRQKNKNTLNSPIVEQDVNFEYPYDEFTPDSKMFNDKTLNAKEGSAVSDNVDFKYISELIHRVDQNNKSDNLPPIEYNPLDSTEDFPPLMQENKFSEYIIPPNAPDNRRLTRPNFHKTDELYYMNLGRQIASMIRGIDTQNKKVNIKLETAQNIPKHDVYFNVNSPKSYWERSVRSPLTFLKSNKKKFEYLKKSNELLFDIENKVEIIASTVPTLTLQEIENMVNVMETNKKDIQKNSILKNLIPPAKTLNINLWPREIPKTRHVIPPLLSKFKNNVDLPIQEHKTNNSYSIDNPENLHRVSVVRTNRLAVQRYPQIPKTRSGKKPASPINFLSKNYPIPPHVSYSSKHNQPKFSDQNSRQTLWQYEMRPPFLKHTKYYSNIHNFFGNPNESLLLPIKPKGGFKRKNGLASYFHHEITNFENIQKK